MWGVTVGNECPDHECDTMYYPSQHHTLPGVGHPCLLSGKAVNKSGMEMCFLERRLWGLPELPKSSQNVFQRSPETSTPHHVPSLVCQHFRGGDCSFWKYQGGARRGDPSPRSRKGKTGPGPEGRLPLPPPGGPPAPTLTHSQELLLKSLI